MRCPNGHRGAELLFNVFRCPVDSCRYFNQTTHDEYEALKPYNTYDDDEDSEFKDPFISQP